jgi:hypothetical protein
MSGIDGRPRFSRRSALKALGAAAVTGGALRWLRPDSAHAAGSARRLFIFYHPDGIPGPSQSGDASKWHPTGSETNFQLATCTSPLEGFKDRSVFFRGLSMGGTDSGSHPGGAKKLLTAVDGGNGESIDQYLARTVGASSYWRHLYLGAQAAYAGASGDKHVVYPAAGYTIPPEDDPRRALRSLFGGAAGTGGTGGTGGGAPAVDPVRRSVLDSVLTDLGAMRARLGGVGQARFDLHLEAVRELERRIGGGVTDEVPGAAAAADCANPAVDTSSFGDAELYDPAKFPAILKAQLDLAVLASACGLTRVSTIQASVHTSELVMSRFPDTPMFDPGFDMRSHQASHYGSRHDPFSREYMAYVQQSQWWTGQFAYLLELLDSLPDGEGTMLDTSLCLMVTEVCDGNTHLHDDMPFVLAGGGNGSVRTGRLLDLGFRRHADLLVSVANAMGQPTSWFGDASGGGVPGLLA